MKLTVNVTDDDIRTGEPAEPCSCPVALAIRRTLLSAHVPLSSVAVVDSEGAGWPSIQALIRYRDGTAESIPLPSPVTLFVQDFDDLEAQLFRVPPGPKGIPLPSSFWFDMEITQ